MARKTDAKRTHQTTTTEPARRTNGRPQPAPQRVVTGSVALPHDRVAMRAYQIYLERGGSHGRDLEDWLQAERELIQPTSRAS